MFSEGGNFKINIKCVGVPLTFQSTAAKLSILHPVTEQCKLPGVNDDTLPAANEMSCVITCFIAIDPLCREAGRVGCCIVGVHLNTQGHY